ncbi:hypothetical protein CBR_g50849 [Chara braunii]|uniref:Intraflagellar transport protein 46 homolog n=1 Tax=Chara braunii TaxID=69332 RepID=A0A388M7E5_CHABU|nr:hypothetical protein CBR_g50849 [Chara braunii]|eukprot:GBG90504.1 hypothetical protein CBR_g50849 [Chara braunii]
MTVTSIDNAAKNPKRITSWISSINDLHKSKPPPQVNYSKAMPDIEKLMQEWPPEIEELLARIQLPTADLDVDLQTFVRVLCTILDIPLYDNLVESLHVMFTLYLAFKNNPHFAQQAQWDTRSVDPSVKVTFT